MPIRPVRPENQQRDIPVPPEVAERCRREALARLQSVMDDLDHPATIAYAERLGIDLNEFRRAGVELRNIVDGTTHNQNNPNNG